VVRAVNNSTHVVGYSYVYSGNLFLTGEGFLWQNGHLEALPLLPGWPAAFAFGINDADKVVGTVNSVDKKWHPPNRRVVGPRAASVMGESPPVNGVSVPVVWRRGSTRELPLLPGETGGFAQEISADVVIAGWQASPAIQIPCIWYPNATGYTAANPGSFGGDFGQPTGINNRNQVVGYSLLAGNTTCPVSSDIGLSPSERRYGTMASPLTSRHSFPQAGSLSPTRWATSTTAERSR